MFGWGKRPEGLGEILINPPSRQRRSLGGIVRLSGMMKEVLPRSITLPSHPSVRLTAPATRADRWIAGGVEEEAFNALSIHLRA